MLVRTTLVAMLALAAVAGCNDKKTETAPSTPASVTGVTSAAHATASDTSSPPKAGALKEGDPAPDVEMTLQDGRKTKLSSLKGQYVAVYFYPKDETPGCTVEAQNFRDRAEDLKKAGITVIGVSAQDASSHKAFIEKEKLPFDLAVDEDASLAKAFGVPSLRPGLHARQTFLIGKDGTIKQIWRDVTPKDHADEVIAAAKS